MKHTRAQDAAERLVRRLRITATPVDVEEVARRLGVHVLYEPLGQETWGVLIACPGAPVVCINRDLPRSKQRVMLAHEIGHIVLRHPFPAGERVHVDLNLAKQKDCPDLTRPVRELEASTFAIALLMPSKQLHDAVGNRRHESLTEDELEQLAQRFGVSPHGVMIRLSRLGVA